jgi:SAM-dependent methyltransferase
VDVPDVRVAHWLLVRGRAGRQLPPELHADELQTHSSTKRPSVQRGDLALCYAAGWQSIFAVVEVVSDPENDPARERWQWRFELSPLLVLSDLREAPPVEAAGVFPSSLGRHSYVRLTPEQFEEGRAALATRLVELGYDTMADRFAEWQKRITGSTRLERVRRLVALLPDGSRVLELGSGAGVASTRILAEHAELVGVEISGEQVRRARERVPQAEFVQGDFTQLELEPASFDAVVAFYVLNHVPRAKLGPLQLSIARWLRPGGFFLGTFGASDTEDAVERDWLGVPMFFAGFRPETNRSLVEAAGLEIVEDEVETILEPEGPGRFHWMLARKPE